VSRAEDLELEITTEVRRLVERLSLLTAPRLTAPAPPYASRATAAHALAQRFVDVTFDIEGGIEGEGATPTLPWVDELTVADQLAVVAGDLREVMRTNPRAHVEPLADLLDEIRRVRTAVQ
jgi:hypothetical protein